MTLLAIVAVAVGVFLWVREWRTPPDRAAHRRLMRELRRHRTELWEREDAT